MVSDIPAGDEKIANLFYSVYATHSIQVTTDKGSTNSFISYYAFSATALNFENFIQYAPVCSVLVKFSNLGITILSLSM
jgi:hypothetical protein